MNKLSGSLITPGKKPITEFCLQISPESSAKRKRPMEAISEMPFKITNERLSFSLFMLGPKASAMEEVQLNYG